MTVIIEERESSEFSDSGTRASLLTLARRRDESAWKELVELYGPLVASWCYACGLDSHSAADCVQEVFAAVSRSMDSYSPQRSTGSFRAWLWTITRNKVRDRIRSEQRHVEAGGGSTAMRSLQSVPDPDSLPDEEPSEDAQINELLSRAMNQIQADFTAKTWAMFHRVVIDSVATDVVAKEFGVTPGAVRQTRSRVLRRIREHLGDCE